jgi:SAM-dependent methyltransferase
MPEPAAADITIEMEEESQYQQQLKLFSECSTEKGIELLEIGEVIAGLPNRQRFLDIGAGGGHLTIPIAQQFEKTTIVEPNERQAHIFLRRYSSFIVHNSNWTDVDLDDERFDLILCSHVLYYIPEGTWLVTIEKMYRHLSEGGCIIIVMQSPLGEVARFFSSLATYDVPIIELTKEVIDRYGDDAVMLHYFQNEIVCDSRDDMVDIGLFLLLDRKFRSRAAEIAAYFDSHHHEENGYRVMQDEILLVIKKIANCQKPSPIVNE